MRTYLSAKAKDLYDDHLFCLRHHRLVLILAILSCLYDQKAAASRTGCLGTRMATKVGRWRPWQRVATSA